MTTVQHSKGKTEVWGCMGASGVGTLKVVSGRYSLVVDGRLVQPLIKFYILLHVPGWNGSRDCARSRGIAAILRPVFTCKIAFQRQNSLKFTRKLARNSFSRFEGDNHGHTPDLA